MRNKQYDLEFWRKPGETDAETRERVYRGIKAAKIYDGHNQMIEIFDYAVGHFWKCALATIIFIIYIPVFFFTAPYHIGRAIILRYLILLRIGAITWYGKRIKN